MNRVQPVNGALHSPLDNAVARALRAGDSVVLTGTIYTARDAAHKRLCTLIERGQSLPVDLSGQILYYTGPTPPRPGRPIGSAGPTTAGRMDPYTPLLLEKTGLKAMIGKGNRCPDVIAALKRFVCVYFAAVGGAGALLARHIRSCQVVCYEDLGPEAVCRLEVEGFPLVVAIDSAGGNLYTEGPTEFALVR